MPGIAVNCLALVLAAGPSAVLPGIAHGENVAAGAYRFSVLLTMTGLPTEGQGTRNSSCSGALIAPRWVITAGHCFRDAGGRRVSRPVAARTTATIGRADLTRRDGHVVEVVAVHQAEGADVALAEIATPITDITPLRVGTVPPTVGEVVRLTGYGLLTDTESATTKRLQTGQFTVEAIGGSLLETSGRAPRPDTSPCPHDSGGPYFQQPRNAPAVLVAVVSSGPGCPHSGPDLSARTDNLSDWIAGTIDRPDHRGYLLAGGLALLAVALGAVVVWRLRSGPRPRRPAPVETTGAGYPADHAADRQRAHARA